MLNKLLIILIMLTFTFVFSDAFAEDTISFYGTQNCLPDIRCVEIFWDQNSDLYINGHVNFSNNKSVNLQSSDDIVIIQTYDSTGWPVGAKSQLSSLKLLSYVDSDGNTITKTVLPFQFHVSDRDGSCLLFPNVTDCTFQKSDRYSVYVFHGRERNEFQIEPFRNYGKIDIYAGITKSDFFTQSKLDPTQESPFPSHKTHYFVPSTIEEEITNPMWYFLLIPIIVGVVIISILYKKPHIKKIRKDPKKRITESDLQNNFSRLDWEDAEDLVGELFKEKGYRVEVGILSESGEQKRSGDFGIDVRAKNSHESIGIQVKHWTANVTSQDVAKTIGYADPFDKIIVISTKSDFTAQTYTAKNDGQFKKAELWNTDKFKDEIRKYILTDTK